MPTRILRITPNSVRLLLSEEYPPNSQYATLSHCWGTLEFLTLTTKNLDVFRMNIPSECLPKTFLDAIGICRYLRIDYLWVYGNAYLNIAATSAEDARVGCFFDRDKRWRCQVLSSKWNSILNVCRASEQYSPGSSHHVDNKLAERGRVVQERYLSRRTLHFTNDEVYWECDENPASEVWPCGYPAIKPYPSLMPGYTPFTLRRRSLIGRWKELVQQYSQASLSYEKDRLTAISGLARHIGSTTNDRFLAGLWQETFAEDLLWRLKRVDDLARLQELQSRGRIKPPTAPTWSWASLEIDLVNTGVSGYTRMNWDTEAAGTV
ncbi:hypothetical protein QBC40DRAFT_303346 [Triangularia verruculosa]|uniref:Heterokaryon incompatibility domain-containing protein n=1 Tax=Triangularia verruculosa TaxID=2587418 RepID=A0AAN7AX96_9PEZI|nr:hypothetical protein QBC40DRAFT_303346 [Triangularia verruculosa]